MVQLPHIYTHQRQRETLTEDLTHHSATIPLSPKIHTYTVKLQKTCCKDSQKATKIKQSIWGTLKKDGGFLTCLLPLQGVFV